LRVFYQKYYQPDNAVLIVGGKFDEDKALQYIEEYFSVIPRPARVLEKTYTVEPAQDGERFVELKRTGDVQYVASMYHVSALADEDYAAMDVLAEILQSDPSGYLYKTLVETKKGSSVFAYQTVLHDPGFFYIGLEVPKSTDFTDSRKAFVASLDAIAANSYTEEDVKRGKAKLMKQVDDITNNTINFSINMTEYIGGGDYRLWYLTRDRYEKVSVDDVRLVAKKYFLSNNRTLGVFIPSGMEERIKPEEFDDVRIAGLTAGYKGRKIEENMTAFEASIPNVKAHLTEKKSDSGLRYSFLKKPIKGGKVMISFRFPTGDAESLFGKSEIASMMARLMTAGTNEMSKEQLRDKLDAMKSSFGFYWGGQSLYLTVSTYESSLTATMDLVKQCLTAPSFPENELEKTKAELKSNIESQMNEPQSLVFNVFSRKTEDYTRGHIFYSPTAKEQLEDVSTVTRQQIVDFHARYVGVQNGIGTVIGDLDQAKVDAVVSSTFSTSVAKAVYKRFIPVYSTNKPYNERINTPDKENGAVACGANIKISRKSPDYPALMMANEMLGSGGFLTSRIPIRLREKEGLSYGAGSQLDVPLDNESGGWMAYAFYNPKMVGRVDTALHEEISSAIMNGFTAEELATSKVSWKNDRTTALGTDNFLMSMINNAMFTGTSIEEFDKLITAVDKLKVEEVNAAIKKYLSVDGMVFIYAGDFSKK
ncbi:MAG: M16 family metallopeptidase, partial [Bacteroidota bacterium]